jgi:hypothetical protein
VSIVPASNYLTIGVLMSSTRVHRMQKALTQMNVMFHVVVTDITGQTGLRIRAQHPGRRTRPGARGRASRLSLWHQSRKFIFARLEHEGRLWKRGAAAMLALLGTMIVLSCAKGMNKTSGAGSDQASSLEVRNLIVVDEHGKPRIVLEVANLGPRLTLKDENGQGRAELLDSMQGPSLSRADENGQLLADFATRKDGTTLELQDENGKRRAELASDKDGPALSLEDEYGRTRAVFGETSLATSDTGATVNTGPSAITLFRTDGPTDLGAP